MAMKFDGYISSESTYSVPTQGSICFWFLPTEISSTYGVCGFTGTEGAHIKFEKGTSQGYITHHMYVQNGVSSTEFADINEWHHVVCTWDGSGDPTAVKIFANGIQNTSTTSSRCNAGNAEFYVGKTYLTDSFNGYIDDFRIYDRVLGDDEIKTVYISEGIDGIVNGLDMRLMLNEGEQGSNP